MLSPRRLLALCGKETRQIVRDPSSVGMAFVLPVIMLFIFGYGLNLDASYLRLALVMEDAGPEARRFSEAMGNSPYVNLIPKNTRQEALAAMRAGKVRGVVIVPADFSTRLARNRMTKIPIPVQLFTDGSEPNTAAFARAYATGVWQIWQQQMVVEKGLENAKPPAINMEARYWFNPSASSRNFLIPGSISLIMTIVGALLSSLIVAREWERGTMEALLTTRVTKGEILLSKVIPYFCLGIISMLLCTFVGVVIMGVPFRGSIVALLLMTGFFLICSLGLGLMLSTIAKDQFLAAQAALVSSYLPALMLSGMVYEIDSMPAAVRAVTYIFPARYFVSSLSCIFQAGDIMSVLIRNALFMIANASILFIITYAATKRRLD